MLFAFFWVIPRRLNFICRRFGTLFLFHLQRQVGVKNDWVENVAGLIREKVFPYKYRNILNPVILHTYLPLRMEQKECSETSAYKIQTPGNYPEESIQYTSVMSDYICSYLNHTLVLTVTVLLTLSS